MRTATEDHMRAIAVRMRDRIEKGAQEDAIRRYLYGCGWNAAEVEKIIKFATKK